MNSNEKIMLPKMILNAANPAWAGKDKPNLEPKPEEVFNVDVPGYDMRRLMAAEDPLAAANAFFVQIRTVLATTLGIRMCPFCPHCADSCNPCQDAFGSVAELMGGVVGCVEAMFGAVECQKTTGALHYHFFVFVQRLHQHASMKEIAEKLQGGLVAAQELKDFVAAISCESYTDLQRFQNERRMLEQNFPAYSEEAKGEKQAVWGAYKLGRLPTFVYDDARVVPDKYSRSAQGTDASPVMAHVDDWVEGAQYKQKFNAVFQYFQSRCQHHIHTLVVDSKTGKEQRIVPNACRAKNNPKQCKHEAPWTNRMSPEWMTQPLLVCKGIAKQFKLRCSGARNWLGQMLGLRNEAWVNACIPGVCVAFAGSNSDIKPNDRLPILDVTHESCCKKKRCLVKKNHLKKTTRLTQRTQTVCLGYFGGYMAKRQPCGKLETKKCMDKLVTLRAKQQGIGSKGL